MCTWCLEKKLIKITQQTICFSPKYYRNTGYIVSHFNSKWCTNFKHWLLQTISASSHYLRFLAPKVPLVERKIDSSYCRIRGRISTAESLLIICSIHLVISSSQKRLECITSTPLLPPSSNASPYIVPNLLMTASQSSSLCGRIGWKMHLLKTSAEWWLPTGLSWSTPSTFHYYLVSTRWNSLPYSNTEKRVSTLPFTKSLP